MVECDEYLRCCSCIIGSVVCCCWHCADSNSKYGQNTPGPSAPQLYIIVAAVIRRSPAARGDPNRIEPCLAGPVGGSLLLRLAAVVVWPGQTQSKYATAKPPIVPIVYRK